MKYEKARGRSFTEALQGKAAQHVFGFDKANLDAAECAILIAPAGKSAHLELGYMAGKGKHTYVLFDEEPERWDIMYGFCTGVFTDLDALIAKLAKPWKLVDEHMVPVLDAVPQPYARPEMFGQYLPDPYYDHA